MRASPRQLQGRKPSCPDSRAQGGFARSWPTVSSVGVQVGGELTASGDIGARDLIEGGLEKPAVRFSHLLARSQSLLAELAPRLKPAEFADRLIVANGWPLPPPVR